MRDWVQCTGGQECAFDCSCGVNGTASASSINTYFSGRTKVTYVPSAACPRVLQLWRTCAFCSRRG